MMLLDVGILGWCSCKWVVESSKREERWGETGRASPFLGSCVCMVQDHNEMSLSRC